MKEKEYFKKIIKNIFWMIFDKIFLLLLNLLVTVKVANYYGADEYGNYQYIVNLVAIFEIIVNIIDSRVVKKKYLSDNPDVIVWNVTICRIFFSSVATILGIIYVFVNKFPKMEMMIFVILLINAIIIDLRFGITNRYEYTLKSKKIAISGDIAAFIGGCLQLVAVYNKMEIIVIAIIATLTSIINLIVLLLQYRLDFGKITAYKLDKCFMVSVVKESLPLAIAASCYIIYSRCDALMIGKMLSKSDVGVYSIAVKMVAVVQIAIGPIRESFYPKLIQLYKEDKNIYEIEYIKVSAILTWVYIIGVVISFILLPLVFSFFDEEYSLAFPIYRIYVLGTFFMYNAGLRAGHYTLINKGNIMMYSQIISVCINVILNVIFIKSIGLYGAAVATVITQAVSLMFSNLLFGKEGYEVLKWQIKALNPMKMLK